MASDQNFVITNACNLIISTKNTEGTPKIARGPQTRLRDLVCVLRLYCTAFEQ